MPINEQLCKNGSGSRPGTPKSISKRTSRTRNPSMDDKISAKDKRPTFSNVIKEPFESGIAISRTNQSTAIEQFVGCKLQDFVKKMMPCIVDFNNIPAFGPSTQAPVSASTVDFDQGFIQAMRKFHILGVLPHCHRTFAPKNETKIDMVAEIAERLTAVYAYRIIKKVRQKDVHLTSDEWLSFSERMIQSVSYMLRCWSVVHRILKGGTDDILSRDSGVENMVLDFEMQHEEILGSFGKGIEQSQSPCRIFLF